MADTAATIDDIVDKRSLHIKPCKYKGNENEWATWRFVFRNFLTPVASELIAYMDEAEEREDEIEVSALGEIALAASNRVYAILAQFLDGAAAPAADAGQEVQRTRGVAAATQEVRAAQRTAQPRGAAGSDQRQVRR